MAGETLGERMARAESWIEGHELRCEERQQALGREVRDLKKGQDQVSADLRGLVKGAWGVALAVIAWGAIQLYQDLKKDRSPVAPPAAIVAPAGG